MESNPCLRARDDSKLNPQDRNRTWWEQLPMTYEKWEDADRSTNRERVVANFLNSNPWLSRDYFKRFGGKEVLEIGCGAGPATCLFAEYGANVTAIDLTDAAVNLTTANSSGLPVKIQRMDAEHLDFPPASFDHVFSWGVLHHSAEPVKAFSEVARVLKPGGTVLIMVYNRASLKYYLKGLIYLLLKRRLLHGDTLASVQRFYTDGYYHKHFTPGELTRALTKLRVTQISISHMAKKMIPGIPRWLDDVLKRKYDLLLIVEGVRENMAVGGLTGTSL
jgi:SAM-dependent methyltransferase